jgi:hypothetical protein
MIMNSLIKWLIYGFLMLGSLIASGCDNRYNINDIQDTYSVKYPYGIEELVLKENGSYEQLFAINGQLLNTINKGKWGISNVGEKQIILIDPVIVDNGFGKPTKLEKKKGGWPLRIKKGVFDNRIYFPINEDLDFEFRRKN